MVVSLYLDARATTGEAPVKASISDKSRRILVPMGVKVHPSQWDAENRVVKNHPNRKEINSFLTGKKSDIELELLRLERLGKLKGASIASIKRMVLRFLNGEEESVRFVERFQHYLSLKTAKKTVKGYRWTLEALKDFDAGFEQRTFDEIGVDYLKEFVTNCTKKGLSRNSVNIHLRYVRAVFNDAISAGVTQAYPFRSISIRPLPVRKKALTPDQLRLLFSCSCVISEMMLSKGTLTQTSIDCRTVLRNALLVNAASVILLHNHPSGDPRPSVQDIHFTDRLKKACSLMDISLVDHIVIGKDGYFSFAEEITNKF